ERKRARTVLRQASWDPESLRQFLQPEPDQLRGFGVLAGAARRRRNRRCRLRLAVAEVDERRDRVGDRPRRTPVVDRAGQMHQCRIDMGEGRRPVLQLGDDALGDLRANARRACHRRLVAERDRVGKLGGRQGRKHCQRHLGADALHRLQQSKPFAFDIVAKPEQLDLVLAHIGFDRQHRGFAGPRQHLQGSRRAMHLITDPADVEDHMVLAVAVDQALQLADHSPTTLRFSAALPRWCACVIATASASAASADFGSAFGSRIFSITRIWFLSAWPAPTTVFLTWFGAYSATGIPSIAGASIATPRACPSLSVATPSLLTKVCSTAASTGRKSSSTAASPLWIASRRCASGRLSGGSTEPQPTKVSRLPSISITPHPVRRRPGSMPRMRMGWRIGCEVMGFYTPSWVVPACASAQASLPRHSGARPFARARNPLGHN